MDHAVWSATTFMRTFIFGPRKLCERARVRVSEGVLGESGEVRAPT
jgi:hypothetical protein